MSRVVFKGVLCENSKNLLGLHTIKSQLRNWSRPVKRNPIACVYKKKFFFEKSSMLVLHAILKFYVIFKGNLLVYDFNFTTQINDFIYVTSYPWPSIKYLSAKTTKYILKC